MERNPEVEKRMEKVRENEMLLETRFVLDNKISQSPYITKGIRKLAGKKVTPISFAVRKTAAVKQILAEISDGNGRFQFLPLACFKRHPHEQNIRENNHIRVI
ncbi:hypothetical protein HOC90_04250 [Candidatus Falkowbacteria bacterium]|jgi:hypothetical protein|nr:hypothetical protein [Elusimicrobiaceae bacterium]MBT4433528.1 hypothetical protein [Candidatus Falkowbacteria bacterium]